ncbi:MAG: hypothetical protein IPK16_21215 [Anaerolineales bacterium]|nr:hypothetical protein [Anaerolineales bacterium]
MSEQYQRFNLDTMSGISPGTRTRIFQRVRLRTGKDPQIPLRWARVWWYEDPAECLVVLEDAGAQRKDEASGDGAGDVVLRLQDPLATDFAVNFIEAFATTGFSPVACATCTHWGRLRTATGDGMGVGRCLWQRDRATHDLQPVDPALAMLTTQGVLALACDHWEEAIGGLTEVSDATAPLAPMPKAAERDSNERWTLWGQLRRWFGRTGTAPPSDNTLTWEEKLVERSGVGAGTESCFVCQGRIANLGALAVATPEGDKQTYSIWRCRSCYTYYLNDWIDRWERTDSLETEEKYYRLAPVDALAVLSVIDNIVHAEHPARRYERDAQRAWMLNFLGGRDALSHQIRQGR